MKRLEKNFILGKCTTFVFFPRIILTFIANIQPCISENEAKDSGAENEGRCWETWGGQGQGYPSGKWKHAVLKKKKKNVFQKEKTWIKLGICRVYFIL